MSDDKKVTVEITFNQPGPAPERPFDPFFLIEYKNSGDEMARFTTAKPTEGIPAILEAVTRLLSSPSETNPFCSSEALCVLAGRCVRAMGPLGRVCNE